MRKNPPFYNISTNVYFTRSSPFVKPWSIAETSSRGGLAICLEAVLPDGARCPLSSFPTIPEVGTGPDKGATRGWSPGAAPPVCSDAASPLCDAARPMLAVTNRACSRLLSQGRCGIVLPDDGARARGKRRRRGIVRRWTEPWRKFGRGGWDEVGMPEPGVRAGRDVGSHDAHRDRSVSPPLFRRPVVRVTGGNRGDPEGSGGSARGLLLLPRGPERLARPEGAAPDGGIRGGRAGETRFCRARRRVKYAPPNTESTGQVSNRE